MILSWYKFSFTEFLELLFFTRHNWDFAIEDKRLRRCISYAIHVNNVELTVSIVYALRFAAKRINFCQKWPKYARRLNFCRSQTRIKIYLRRQCKKGTKCARRQTYFLPPCKSSNTISVTISAWKINTIQKQICRSVLRFVRIWVVFLHFVPILTPRMTILNIISNQMCRPYNHLWWAVLPPFCAIFDPCDALKVVKYSIMVTYLATIIFAIFNIISKEICRFLL